MPIRVEAASYHGKIVSFHVIKPYTPQLRLREWKLTRGQKAASMIGLSIFSIILIGAALLARYNLRRGRGDRQGAFRLAAFMFAVNLLIWLLRASHVPTLHEIKLLIQAVSVALFQACVIWLLYVALEPFARRRWPATLISWNRVLAGDFRDPRVGRDVLLGITFGTCSIQMVNLIFYVAQVKFGNPPDTSTNLSTLLGVRYLVGHSLFILSDNIRWALGVFFLIFLLRVILRRQWLAAGVFVLIVAISVALGNDYPLTYALATLLLYGLIHAVLLRLGLVSVFVIGCVLDLLILLPVTLNFSAWYAGSSLSVMLAVLALAIWAFHTSLGGQKVFAGKLLEE
jgi:serine/threonine-protein kinase